MAGSSVARKRAGARRAADAKEKLPGAIRLKRKLGGREKRVGTGFAWDLFLFAGFFGVPLFWRRLPQWGAAVLVLWLLVFVAGSVRASQGSTGVAELLLFVLFLVLQVGLGFYGNRLMAKTLLAHGWVIDQPNDPGTKRVIERWGLAS
jgi:hypothetical protein